MAANLKFPQTLHPTALPLELVDALNQTYFLHLLANEPDKVIPPGKSLLSMLALSSVVHENQDESKGREEKLEDRIRQLAHKAFWDEALKKLSSPQPSIQLQRLRLLYNDLKDALAPLFPLNHPTVQALSSPLAPTTSPLHSAVLFLKDVLLALRSRCAPARDQMVDDLLLSLDEVPPYSVIRDSSPLQQRNHSVVKTVLSVMQSTLTLSEVLKADLNQFVLGTATETQLNTIVRQQAKVRERELVLKLWSTPGTQGQQAIREGWRAWVEQLDGSSSIDDGRLEDRWKLRLLQALQSSMPVSCVASPSNTLASPGKAEAGGKFLPPKTLPPQFLFTVPTLVTVQNYMQALIITATLRSLLRIPTSSNTSERSPASIVANFTQRVWVLLEGEIEANQTARGPSDIGETKIVHFVDELVYARRSISEITPEEEKRLRAAAENLLRPEDPVYLLFQRRLVTAVREKLFSRPATPSDKENRSRIPEKLKTGKDNPNDRAGKRPKLGSWFNVSSETLSHKGANRTDRYVAPPKGYEDQILALGVNRMFSKFVCCVAWVEEVWGDLV